jgi:hypothetical protein
MHFPCILPVALKHPTVSISAGCAVLQACERALLQLCSKNPYQRALLLTQIAAYHPSSERQAASLQVSRSFSCVSHPLLYG